jgi:hypothetical protein
MKRFTTGPPNETPEEERIALMADIVHLREQSKRYSSDEGDVEVGGIGGLLMREKTRLFNMLHNM